MDKNKKREYYAKNKEKICLQERMRREAKRPDGLKRIGRYVPKEEMLRDFCEITGIEGYYVNRNGEIVGKHQRVMVGHVDRCGYREVIIRANGMNRQFLVHRIVAETFLVKIEGKDFVNHKDGNKLNNCVANLEWVTKSENAIHSYRTGLQDNVGGRPIIRGEKLEFIRNNMSKMKDKEIALILGCARETVGVNRRKITRGES